MSTERFNPPWPDAGAGHRHLYDHEVVVAGDEYWCPGRMVWTPCAYPWIGLKVVLLKGYARRKCDWAKPKTAKPTPRISDFPEEQSTERTMLTAEQMKKRTAEQTEVKNRRVEEAVSALAAAWIAELELGLTVVYEGSAPMFEVSVTANRFEKPPKDLDFQEIELSAADRVIHTFMNRGFNAFRHVVGTVAHQRVTVVWDS